MQLYSTAIVVTQDIIYTTAKLDCVVTVREIVTDVNALTCDKICIRLNCNRNFFL